MTQIFQFHSYILICKATEAGHVSQGRPRHRVMGPLYINGQMASNQWITGVGEITLLKHGPHNPITTFIPHNYHVWYIYLPLRIQVAAWNALRVQIGGQSSIFLGGTWIHRVHLVDFQGIPCIPWMLWVTGFLGAHVFHGPVG